MKNRRRRSPVVLALLLAPAVLAGFARAQVVTEFKLPAGVEPYEIAPGPGGMWFTEYGRSRIGRIAPDGGVTEFVVNRPARSIVAGPNGDLWFTSNKFVSRMTPAGVVADFPVAGDGWGITVGPDGNIWFTETGEEFYGALGRATPSGQITEFPVSALAYDIAVGRDGNFWLPDSSEFGADGITRVTTSGAATWFAFRTAEGSPRSAGPESVALGPDGNVWFTEFFAEKVGRITQTGNLVDFNVPGTPRGIASGMDGHLWFALEGNRGRRHEIGRISTQGHLQEISIPTENAIPWSIAAAPDGSIWFTERGAGQIGRIVVPSTPEPLRLEGGRFLVSVAWSSATSSGAGHPVSLTSSAGYFWFFDPENVEVVVKVLDWCPAGNAIFFAAGLTDLEVSLTLTDSVTGDSRSWVNPRGTVFAPILEIVAYCPPRFSDAFAGAWTGTLEYAGASYGCSGVKVPVQAAIKQDATAVDGTLSFSSTNCGWRSATLKGTVRGNLLDGVLRLNEYNGHHASGSVEGSSFDLTLDGLGMLRLRREK